MREIDSEIKPDISPARWSRIDLAFLLFVSAFIFLQLFILPFTPVYVEGDQLLPVSNAFRILNGEVMYRDIFHIAPPGAEYYYSAMFSVFGVRIWILNATVFVLAIAQALLLIIFSKRLLTGVYVYLPTLLYFVIGFRLYGIDGSFRLFSVVFVLLAAVLILKTKTPVNLVLSGILCGFASFFVQTRGVLGVGALGLFLLWLHYRQGISAGKLLRDWLYIGGAFVLTVLATQSYPAYAGGLDNYYFSVFTFIKDYYRSDTLSNTFAYFTDMPDLRSYMQSFGTAAGLFRYFRVAGPTLFIYAVVPLIYVVFFIFRKVRIVEEKTDAGLMLLSILGIVLYLGVSAPTAFRLYHISIPAMIVLVWLIKRGIRREIAMKGVTIALVVLAALYSVQRQIVAKETLDLPAGRAVFLSSNMAEKYKWLANETKPGEVIFEAQHPTFYFPLLLANPTPFYLVRDNNYTPPFQVDQLMQALEIRRPRFIIWHGGWSKEASERKPGDNLAPLWEFIRKNYELRKEFRELGEYTTNSERDIEFWELKK